MKDDILAATPPTGVRFEQNTEAARLVDVLASAYYRLDTDIDQLRRDRYVETATGRELDRRGRPLGVQRPAGESDDAFRRRALAGRARAISETTFEDFATAVLEVLDADPSDVELIVDYEDELGAVIVQATSAVFDAAPLSEGEVIRLLEGAIPLSRRVVLRREDGFQFSVDGTAEGKGFGEGAWTS